MRRQGLGMRRRDEDAPCDAVCSYEESRVAADEASKGLAVVGSPGGFLPVCR